MAAGKSGTGGGAEQSPARRDNDQVQPFRHQAHDEEKHESDLIGAGGGRVLPVQV
jgi:hypothetical protein